ncbi:unnamed protein product, partial [Mesorhabditis belari]|uniref:Uncharacterized protein n=1 Tax=Mesorhabditis belari TaxID=2138241 RepID=A0AAF3FE72_9BILA
MVIIEQSLIDLPTLLTNTIRHTAKMKDRSRVAFAYKRINKRIERAAKTCHDVAINTTITFQQVLYEIDELQQATMGAESRNQVVVGQHKNTSIFLAQREASMREKLKDIERRYKEIQEDRKRALKEFQKQYDKTGKLGRMLAAAAIDLVSFIPQAFMTVYTGGAMAASGSQSGSDPFDGMSNGNLNSESTMARLERIDKDKLSLANARLAEESAREKAQFDAMLKEKEAFAEVIAQLQSINLEVVNLEEVMKVLRQAVQHLGKIRNQWSQLADYFSTLKIVIETKLIGENLNELLEDNEQLAVTGFIEEFSLETSLRFIGYCIQIENSAKLYLSVSKDYIFPVLGRVGGQFGLSKSSAKAEQQHFASHYDKTMAGVKGLVDAEKKQLDARFERQIDIYWKSLKISQQKQITQLLNGTQLLN